MTYDTTAYLLDRANIQDVAHAMYMHFDRNDFDKLEKEVYAAEVTLDYTELFGGEPSTVERSALLERWRVGLRAKAKATQHTISSVIPQLPQPGAANGPTSTTALSNVSAVIRSHKDNLVMNRGRLLLDFVKIEGVEGNPWRISGLKAEVVWQNDVPFSKVTEDFEETQKSSDGAK